MPTVRGQKRKPKTEKSSITAKKYSKYSQYRPVTKGENNNSKNKSKIFPTIIVLVIIVSLFSLTGVFSPNSPNFDDNDDTLLNENDFEFQYTGLKLTLISSETCSCCHEYVDYLRENSIEVDFITTEDYMTIKDENNIPTKYQSCHTMILEGYFVEGHVPIVAIDKLLDERPQIDGISLPGMPSGSPGMPGDKTETFKIHSMIDGSSTGIFAKI